MKLIDKDELLDALENYKDEFSASYSDFKTNARDALCRRVIATIIEDIVNEQSVVKPVKHGHWEKQIEYFGHSFKCSVCNECTIFTQDTPPKFCSKCGARLDGEQK